MRVRLTYELTPRLVIGGRLLAALVLGELFRSQSRGEDTGRLETENGRPAYAGGGNLLAGGQASVFSCAGQANSAAYFFSSTCLGIKNPLYRLLNRLRPMAG
jgi:hypothetical protein